MRNHYQQKRRAGPVIPKIAIRRFLNRERRDFRPWKSKGLSELQSMMEELPHKPPIWKKLAKHQRVCFLIGAMEKQFCFWNDTGTGKTLLSLALILYFRKAGVSHTNLVLVPNKINKDEWRRDVKKHSPNTDVLVLRGSSENKWRQLADNKASIIVETYGGLIRLLSDTVAAKKGTRLKLSQTKLKALRKMISGVFYDESIMLARKKGHGSLMHRICKLLAKTATVRFALNGTPHGKDPTDAWAQTLIIDGGRALGETLGLFRAVFFTAKENYFGGPTYTFKKSMRSTLHDMMAGVSIRYKANAADLPRVVYDVKRVKLLGDAQTYYDRAKAEVLAARGNYREMKNAFMRMRQVSSGFVGYYDDETGEKAKYVFKPNPKMESLISYIESIAGEYKSVVFHEFTFSGDLIAKELTRLKIGFARMAGKTKDPDAELDRFANDKDCRVLVLQNAAGGYGVDRAKVAKYALYYESPVGPVLRKQTLRRVERQYSDHDKIFCVDFIAEGTADQNILNAHKAGFDLFAAIIEGDAAP